ncbi:hypothetical protein DFP72DRAFT_853294 [Ephemerocybe angulata]|uniref:Zinc finger C3HC4 RING-type domain-containing protein n=1 Tax=Ephemerocybe angulata TaxID=980116 RepID=A0A8H6M1X7_9AGAR|nr:hypothetical protein DFP72DRAFT_853294 [Tulosesus angulatus]
MPKTPRNPSSSSAGPAHPYSPQTPRRSDRIRIKSETESPVPGSSRIQPSEPLVRTPVRRVYDARRTWLPDEATTTREPPLHPAPPSVLSSFSVPSRLFKFPVKPDIPDDDDTVTEPQAPTPLEDDQIIERVGDIVGEDGSCDICVYYMARPCQLKCGHTFCVDCLRKHCERQLRLALKTVKLKPHVGHHQDECQAIPTTDFQQKRLLECLASHTSHRFKPTKCFVYDCPMCRAEIKEAPVDNIRLRQLLSKLQGPLSERCDLTVAESDLPFQRPFEGLFLPPPPKPAVIPTPPVY